MNITASQETELPKQYQIHMEGCYGFAGKVIECVVAFTVFFF